MWHRLPTCHYLVPTTVNIITKTAVAPRKLNRSNFVRDSALFLSSCSVQSSFRQYETKIYKKIISLNYFIFRPWSTIKRSNVSLAYEELQRKLGKQCDGDPLNISVIPENIVAFPYKQSFKKVLWTLFLKIDDLVRQIGGKQTFDFLRLLLNYGKLMKTAAFYFHYEDHYS